MINAANMNDAHTHTVETPSSTSNGFHRSLSSSSTSSISLSSSSSASSSSSSVPSTSSPPPSEALIISACICITQLALDDENAYQIRRANGVYILAMLFLRGAVGVAQYQYQQQQLQQSTNGAGTAVPPSTHTQTAPLSSFSPVSTPYTRDVQSHSLRALRFLYSLERNRSSLKRLFARCPDTFAAFVDLGHYTTNIERYERIIDEMDTNDGGERRAMLATLEEMRMQAVGSGAYTGARAIRGYMIQEVLGKGAFGTVYQVQKESGDKLYAMKELSLKDLQKAGISANAGGSGGGGGSSGSTSAEQVKRAAHEMVKEVEILSQLDHPNIVRYYTSFLEGGSVYIIMELVDGTSLLDFIQSRIEKGARLAEEQIWPIFIQITLALCYMHMEKRVVHRDLTPNNILIRDSKVVKIADFGLARQTHHGTVLQSAVGTISFSCPEIVMHETYTDKADIWSLGCILYQMASGKPAFAGSNPLTVAQKIVSGSYDPLPSSYSPLLHEMVRRLLTVDPHARPDILAVSSLISPLLMAELDRVNIAQERMAAQWAHEAECRRRERDEWNRERQTYRKWMAAANSQQRTLHTQQLQLQGTAPNSTASTPTAPHAPSLLAASPSSASGSRAGLSNVDEGLASSSGAPASSPLFRLSTSAVRPTPTSHSPLSLLLSQLHKLVSISQLPPKPHRDLRRLLINKYKHGLFTKKAFADPEQLKAELHKLVTGSQEVVDARFELPQFDAAIVLTTPHGSHHANSSTSCSSGSLASTMPSSVAANASNSSGSGGRITYEELHLIIEQVLEEIGYYAPDPAHLHQESSSSHPSQPSGARSISHTSSGSIGADGEQRG